MYMELTRCLLLPTNVTGVSMLYMYATAKPPAMSDLRRADSLKTQKAS